MYVFDEIEDIFISYELKGIENLTATMKKIRQAVASDLRRRAGKAGYGTLLSVVLKDIADEYEKGE